MTVIADGIRLATMGYSAEGALAMYLATLDSFPKAITPFFPTLCVFEHDSAAHEVCVELVLMSDYLLYLRERRRVARSAEREADF